MKPTYLRKRQTREFNSIFDSLAPFIRSDLERIDGRIERIMFEATACGVSKEVIHRELNRRWIELFLEVANREKVAG